MAEKNESMEIAAQEAVPEEQTERTHARRCFIPRADIYETDDDILVLADIPGAGDKNVDIMLDDSVLTINATIDPIQTKGYELAYAEYDEGDYQRSFRLQGDFDRDKIEATVSQGVLRLRLPKSPAAKARKITVKAN
jgi:HSP20 family protein